MVILYVIERLGVRAQAEDVGLPQLYRRAPLSFDSCRGLEGTETHEADQTPTRVPEELTV
jgi:hypothetical protein